MEYKIRSRDLTISNLTAFALGCKPSFPIYEGNSQVDKPKEEPPIRYNSPLGIDAETEQALEEFIKNPENKEGEQSK